MGLRYRSPYTRSVSLRGRLRQWARRLRSILLPIRAIDQHLGALSRETAVELGIERDLVIALESATLITCHETSLSTTPIEASAGGANTITK